MSSKNDKFIPRPDRLILPQEVRDAMNWEERTPVEIWLNCVQDEVVIKRHEHRCIFCGLTADLKEFQRQYVCPDCMRGLAQL